MTPFSLVGPGVARGSVRTHRTPGGVTLPSVIGLFPCGSFDITTLVATEFNCPTTDSSLSLLQRTLESTHPRSTRGAMVVLFACIGLGQLLTMPEFRESLKALTLIPHATRPNVAWGLPVIEILPTLLLICSVPWRVVQ